VDASALDRDVCREHLAEVLAEEASLLVELRSLLEREYEVLGTKDAIAVERTVLARQERMGALTRVEEQRRSLCSLHGYSADHAGLERLMVWCDPQGTLVSRLRDCGLLGALTGRGSSADTYSSNGSTAPTRPGRVLGAA